MTISQPGRSYLGGRLPHRHRRANARYRHGDKGRMVEEFRASARWHLPWCPIRHAF